MIGNSLHIQSVTVLPMLQECKLLDCVPDCSTVSYYSFVWALILKHLGIKEWSLNILDNI